MCFKKKISPAAIISKYVYLGFGINDYMGAANDLRGCINDINDEVKKLNREFPEFQCLKYFNRQVTTQFFVEEIQRVMSQMPEDGFLYIKYSGHGTQIPSSSEADGYNEALYLYNGPLIDDEIYRVQQQTPIGLKVLAKFDSCFSGDLGSRNFFGNPIYIKARFMPLQGIRLRHKPINRLARTDYGQRWTIFAGCGEEQTCADAFINGKYCGAFTWADLQSYSRNTIYIEELKKDVNILLLNKFNQVPELSGPDQNEVFMSNN